MINEAKIHVLLRHEDWNALHALLDETLPGATERDAFLIAHWRVTALKWEGRHEEALDFLDKNLGAFPCRCSALHGKARLLQTLGREHEALRALEEAPVEAEIASWYALVTDMLFFRALLGAKHENSYFAFDLARIPADHVSLFPDGSRLSKQELERQIAEMGADEQPYMPPHLPTIVTMGFQLSSEAVSLQGFAQYFPGRVEQVYDAGALARFGITGSASGRERLNFLVLKRTGTQNLAEINTVIRKCMSELHRDSYVAAHLRSHLIEAVLWMAVSGSAKTAIADLAIEHTLFGKPYGLVAENYTSFDAGGLPEKLLIEPGKRM